MKHLFIIDPIETFNPKKDTTLALMEAAQRLGSEVWGATLDDLTGRGGYVNVRATRYSVDAAAKPFFTVEEATIARLDEFQVVWMRKDPPFNMQYVYATYLLDLVDPTKTLVMNRPQGLRNANEKAFILQFPDVITDTAIGRTRRDIREIVEEFGGKAVIKPLDLMGGSGIFVLRTDDGNFNSIVDAVTKNESEFVMLQRFLPAAAEGDKRIILIDGKPLGAILRVPQGVDFRGNMAAGGIATKIGITDREHEIIERVAPKLREEGLYLVGLDVIGGFVTEINVTSPTGVREINAFDGVSIGDDIVGWAEAKIRGN